MAARLSEGLSGGLPRCHEACQAGCQTVRRPARRAARLSGGLSGKLPGRQEACRDGGQAARRPSWALAVGQQGCRAVQEAPEPTANHRNAAQLNSSQRSKLCKWPAMGLDLLDLLSVADLIPQ